MVVNDPWQGEKNAQKLGYDTVSVVVTKKDKAGYMPEVENITLKLVADRRSHRILGAQAIGCGDADKKINNISIGLAHRVTVENLLDVDFTYDETSGYIVFKTDYRAGEETSIIIS